jgi:hypothetical protein
VRLEDADSVSRFAEVVAAFPGGESG